MGSEALRRESDGPAQIYQAEKQSVENVSRAWNMRGGVQMDALLPPEEQQKLEKLVQLRRKGGLFSKPRWLQLLTLPYMLCHRCS